MSVIGRGLPSSGGMWYTTVICLQAMMQRKSAQISHILAVGTSNLTQLGAVGSGAKSKQIFFEIGQGINQCLSIDYRESFVGMASGVVKLDCNTTS
jgi:hypothetical protein